MPIDRKIIVKLRKAHLEGLHSLAVEMTNRSKQRATRHNDNGIRRNSVTQTKRLSDVLWGIPLSVAPHARYLELGFSPHFVSIQNIGTWMQRNRVGYVRVRSHTKLKSGKRSRKYRTFLGAGIYVGGFNSRLQTAPGGTTGVRIRGKKRLRSSWYTRGGVSKFLPNGKVGHPILKPVAAEVKSFSSRAFIRGFSRVIR